MLILRILRDYGMDSLYVMENRPRQRCAAVAFCAHGRFADCRLRTAFDLLSIKRGTLFPGSRPPREPGKRKIPPRRPVTEFPLIFVIQR